jgi:hypothetical protein
VSAEVATAAPRRAVALDWLAGAAVAALLVVVYLHSPQRRFLDSRYALLGSQALLDHADFDLAPYLDWTVGAATPPVAEDDARDEDGEADDGEAGEAGAPSEVRPRLPYQLKETRGRLLYLYSPGTSIFSAPLVWVAGFAGYSPLGPEGRYEPGRELELQALLAAWLTAGTGLLVYRVARRELPPLPSAAVALVAGLGSGLWSAASRVMWTHTWSSLLVAAAWLELLRWEDGERRRGWLVGGLMVALYWVRPTGAVIGAAIAIYVFLKHRRALPALLAVGAAGLLAYFLYSLHYWGTLLPRYFRVGRHLLDERPRAPLVFFELLISPGHGLFAFSPVLLLVLWWLVRYRPSPSRRAFALFTLAAFFGFVALYSRWGWGGTVGPRFLCDPTALLAWLGAHGWRRAREVHLRPAFARRAATAAAALALLAASAAAHGGVAWDLRRAGGPAAAAAGASPRTKVPYLQRSYWKWRGLPQLQLPDILDTLEQRRGRIRRGGRPAAAPGESSP